MIESFYPYCFNKEDKLMGMDSRHGSIFMEILTNEFGEEDDES